MKPGELREAQQRVATINQANQPKETPMSSTEELVAKITQLVKDATAGPDLSEVRQALNEAGISKARQRLTDSLTTIDSMQTALREAQETARQTGDALEQAIAAAEWELDARFVVEGNKTWLVDGEDRKSMTADERKAWKQAEARKMPAVELALKEHRVAEGDVNEARDAVTHADRSFSAAKHDLQASVAIVSTYAASIGRN